MKTVKSAIWITWIESIKHVLCVMNVIQLDDIWADDFSPVNCCLCKTWQWVLEKLMFCRALPVWSYLIWCWRSLPWFALNHWLYSRPARTTHTDVIHNDRPIGDSEAKLFQISDSENQAWRDKRWRSGGVWNSWRQKYRLVKAVRKSPELQERELRGWSTAVTISAQSVPS